MASPEVIEPSGTLDSGFHEDLSAPEGWKKKLMLKKGGGTPKKKDVVYIAPDGEEIRNKRHLEKYLKNHPGGPSVADFDWSTGETPRRSARLSSKGRLSSDSTEAEPAPKRSKGEQEEDEETCVVVSPKKPSRRKSGPQAVVTAEKDEVMENAEKTEGENTAAAADGAAVSADVIPVEEKVAASSNEAVEDTEDGKQGEKEITVTIGDVKLGESAEQVSAAIEEVAIVGNNSAEKVNAEELVSKVEETVIVTDTVMGEASDVVVDAVILEEPAVEEVVKPSVGETSVKEEQEAKTVVNEDILYVPTTEKVDEKDDDPLKPKELIESQGIHALIDEPVTKSPEQTTTEPSLPAAERVGVST